MDLNKRLNNGIKSLTKLLYNLDSLSMNMINVFIPRTLIMTIILCLYVNNIHILVTSLDAIQRVKDYLSLNFDMKDLGLADIVLGIKKFRTPNGISFSLFHSIEIMLHKFDFYNSKLISTPHESSLL